MEMAIRGQAQSARNRHRLTWWQRVILRRKPNPKPTVPANVQ
jgi:hypothetical protein